MTCREILWNTLHTWLPLIPCITPPRRSPSSGTRIEKIPETKSPTKSSVNQKSDNSETFFRRCISNSYNNSYNNNTIPGGVSASITNLPRRYPRDLSEIFGGHYPVPTSRSTGLRPLRKSGEWQWLLSAGHRSHLFSPSD